MTENIITKNNTNNTNNFLNLFLLYDQLSIVLIEKGDL